MSNKIVAYMMRVDEESGQIYQGYFGEIDNTLKAKQDYVGYNQPHSLIQVIGLTDSIDVIMNDEGKLKGYPVNRAILDEDGQVLDFIVGNCLCVRHNDEGEFISIKESDKELIEKHLIPILLVTEKGILTVPADTLPEYKEV